MTAPAALRFAGGQRCGDGVPGWVRVGGPATTRTERAPPPRALPDDLPQMMHGNWERDTIDAVLNGTK